MIAEKFVELGAAPEAAMQETILIRDGFYCGRKLRCDGMHAIWFVEENEVKFFDGRGSLHCVLNVSDTNNDLRRAG